MLTAANTATFPSGSAPPARRGWRRHWALAVICLVFAALRLPVACRQIPAQDEDYFAVPGLTILREGIPRIPYMPSRNPQGAFYKADELLFTLPPLYFYWQALIYLCFGPSTAAARLASMLCGIAAIVVVHRMSHRWFRDERAALWSAGLYAASRIVYFPVVIARPDMLCGALGLGALLAVEHWTGSPRKRWLVTAGAALGACALAHPFAIVPAIQSAAWTFVASRDWSSRLRNVGILTTVAILVFLLWLPLICLHPEAFRSQFTNAVLNQSGPGFLSRLCLPFRSLLVQTPIFLEHVGPLQAALMIAGAAGAAALAMQRTEPGLRTAATLAWTGVYLHVACVGGHPTKGYWCYTGALLFICVGGLVARLLRGIADSETPTAGASPPRPRWRLRTVAALAAAAAVMLPGAGLRTVVAHVRHWDDVNYDAPRFTRQLLAEVPAGARLVVDPGYIFDFYRAGRDVTLALDYEFFFSVRGTEYDLVVAGPYSIRDRVPQALGAILVRSYGDRTDLFACYAELYAAPDGDVTPNTARQ
jgi:hypothetical protein